MKHVGIHEAKTHLSRLVDEAARGEAFVITKSGNPLVKVIPIDAPDEPSQQRLGFLAGMIRVPDDFDSMGAADIARSFEGDDATPAP